MIRADDDFDLPRCRFKCGEDLNITQSNVANGR